ncbi:MAG TPA: hypothetical protein VNQ79_20575 [Blastocatellia bacterium]|nr:hypothetical protein [Blastocatellia bacterium]
MRLRKVSSFLLLLALLGASLHAFAHLGEAGNHSLPTLRSGSQSESGQPGGASLGGNHTCLACQSLQHHQSKAPAAFVLVLGTERLIADWRVLLPHSAALSGTPADRAPPLV